MSQWTIGKRITLGFAAVLLITGGLGAFALYKLKTINAESDTIVTDCLPGMYLAGQIEASVKENYTLTLKHLVAATPEAKSAVEQEMKATKELITARLAEYEKTITMPEDRRIFDSMAPLRAKFLEIRDTAILPLSKQNKTAEAVEAIAQKLEPAFKPYTASVGALVTFNQKNGEDAGARITKEVEASLFFILSGIAVAIVIGAFIAFVITRGVGSALSKVASMLQSGAEMTASSSTQVSSASQSLASGASEQASSLEETSASLEELSSMTRQNADTAQQAHALAKVSASTAESGMVAMSRMTDAINRIKNSSDQTAKILKTIDEIAFQTNLLALNAAVEAARAGDAGKGFAVVAEEVRNLAQRSAEAARSTATLIEESQKNADGGVSVSAEVGETLAKMGDTAGKLQQMVNEVAAASTEQSKGIEQINTAVSQMDKITQTNAASAEESASASEELSAQAREMESVVEMLLQLVGGSNKAASMAPLARPQASAAPKAKVSHEREPVRAKSDSNGHHAHANGNGNGVNRVGKLLAKHHGPSAAEKVIPLNDGDMTDF